MSMERFNPPGVPEKLPWEDIRQLTTRLDRLISLMEVGVAARAPGVVPMFIPGAPGTTEQLVVLMRELVPESIGSSAIIPFQKTVAVAYQDDQDRQVPFSGIIRDVIMGFPAGCQQYVEVRLVYYPQGGSKKYIVPTLEDSFIALDDFTVLFQPRLSVKAPGNLRVEWWNYDSLNVHTVPVVVTVTPSRLGV